MRYRKDSRNCKRDEPDNHNWSECDRDFFGSLLLERKKEYGDNAGDNDECILSRVLKSWDKQQTFHGAEYTDGRSDYAVTYEE